MTNHIQSKGDPGLQENGSIQDVISPLTQISTQIAGGYEATAPVKIPDQKDLTVRLVNISQIQRLDELRGDVILMQTILSTGVGAILGFFTNVVTASQPIEKQGFVFICTISAVTLLFGCLTIRASRRERDLKRILFDDSNK